MRSRAVTAVLTTAVLTTAVLTTAVLTTAALTTAAQLYLGTAAASAQGLDTQPNPAHLSYDCLYPNSTLRPVVADLAWTASSNSSLGSNSSVQLNYVSVTLSGGLVDELRAAGAASVGGVFGPVLTPTGSSITAAPSTALALARLLSLPKASASMFALIGTWIGATPSFAYASENSFALTADTFVLQLAADRADGTSVTLPASVTCTSTAGQSNPVFAHTPRVCSGSETPAPSDSGDVCAMPATPSSAGPPPPVSTPVSPPVSTANPSADATPTPSSAGAPSPSSTAETPHPSRPSDSPNPPPAPTTAPSPSPSPTHVEYHLSGVFSLPAVSGTGRVGPGRMYVDVIPSTPGFVGPVNFSGAVTLPTSTVQGNLFGFIPITVVSELTQAGPLSGSFSPDHVAKAEFPANISLKSVTLLGLLPLPAGTCRTARPIEIRLMSGVAGSFSPITGGALTGSFAMGTFSNCGAVTPFVNQLVAGVGNTVTFTATPA